MEAVTLSDITKVYGKEKTVAVDKINFNVHKGELFGLIGPDGAGKTSIFRILTTVLLPDGGSATVEGFDVIKDYKKIRNTVGYMPGKFSLYPDLTIEENLNFFATLFETTIQENYDLIKEIYVQIEPFKKRKAGKLSGGMKQKLALCCALIHKPAVLFLDEPTTGVDVVSRKEFWEMLKRLKEQNISILVSTPYMDEASMCDRIALMQQGKIMAMESPEAIINSFKKPLLAIHADDTYETLKDIRKYNAVENAYPFGEFHHVVMKENYDADQFKNYLEKLGHKNVIIKQVKAGIEDVFIELMNTKNNER